MTGIFLTGKPESQPGYFKAVILLLRTLGLKNDTRLNQGTDAEIRFLKSSSKLLVKRILPAS